MGSSVYDPEVTRCPYCQTQIHPQAPECPACMMTFPRTGALVGAMPRLNPIVADTTGRLNSGVADKIRKRIAKIQRKFSQVVIQVVMNRFPDEHPLAMHAFWLFNSGAFAGEGKRGEENHSVMILVDPYRYEAAVVPGYGLEPLLQDAALAHLLEMAGPALLSQQWELGIEVILDGLDQLLELVSEAGTNEYAENDF